MSNPTMDLVEFPGEPTLRAGGAVPPVRVRLPLKADPRRGQLVAMALYWGLLAVIMMISAAALASEPVPTPWTKAVAIWGFAVSCAAISVQLAGMAVTCVVDLLQPSPFLVITPDGIFDRRMLPDPLVRRRGGPIVGRPLRNAPAAAASRKRARQPVPVHSFPTPPRRSVHSGALPDRPAACAGKRDRGAGAAAWGRG
jgi:hypothetical protein